MRRDFLLSFFWVTMGYVHENGGQLTPSLDGTFEIQRMKLRRRK
jgi:hypothetical protein